MKKIMILLVSVLFFVSCNKESADNQQALDENKVFTLQEIMSDDFEYKGGNVIVEGLCVHVCSHSGKKMFISTKEGDDKLQIFTSESIASFSKDYEGNTLQVKGTLEEERIDMDYVKEWEAELAKENAEDSESCEFEENMQKIEAVKAKVAKSKKGYISKFTMTGIEVKQI